MEIDYLPEKIQGYLEKRSKSNIWHWWKKYWFVLDGKMLLYFKSKENYEQLGHCKGSINMALAQAVQPSTSARRSYPLEIIMRMKIVQLSASDEDHRQRWLLALQNAIRLPEISSPVRERLSSRLSSTFSIKRPFSKTENENSVFEFSNGRESIKSKTSNELRILEAYYNVQTSEDETKSSISSDVFANNDQELDRLPDSGVPCKDVDNSSEASTLTLNLKDGENEQASFQEVKNNPKPPRERNLSLYEEIVEEVLEIAGKRLSSSASQQGNADDQEYLTELSEVLNNNRSEQPQEMKLSCRRCSSSSSCKVAPNKPPRTPSIKYNKHDGIEKSSMTNAGLPEDHKEVKGPEVVDSDVYESANESCYVTAESSEYEEDASSFSSSTYGDNMPRLSTMLITLEVPKAESASSEVSMESIRPQTGSMCNMLDVTDDDEARKLDDLNGNVPSKPVMRVSVPSDRSSKRSSLTTLDGQRVSERVHVKKRSV